MKRVRDWFCLWLGLMVGAYIMLLISGCQFTSGVGTAIKGLGADIENASNGYRAQQAYQDGLNGKAYNK